MVKILIVDDSIFSQKTNANLMGKYLKDVQIYFAKDGEEGFIKYKMIKPDYIFIDLLMPKISGQELLRQVKEFDRDAKIFVVSADVQKSVKAEIEAHHIMGFINKPFNEEKAQLVCEMIRKEEVNGQMGINE